MQLFSNIRLQNAYTLFLLFFAFECLSESAAQKSLVVIDLSSDGTVSAANIKTISDKISDAVSAHGGYTQFSRKMLPDLFRQLKADQSAVHCSDPQCLAVVGNFIGSNFIIGGMASLNQKQMSIRLHIVDVKSKNKLNSVSVASTAKKDIFLAKELPALVYRLLDFKTVR